MVEIRWVPAIALAVALTGVALAFSWGSGLPPSSFKAFYCAGSVVEKGGDPYAVEPLRACEHAVAPHELPAYAVEPAPLPGYALAFTALLARTPFKFAHALYVLLAFVAFACIAVAVAGLTGLPPLAAALPFLSLWFLNVAYGEVPPFATAGIALCALALRRKQWWLAAVGASIAAVEPHVAAPLWLALFLFGGRVRAPLAILGSGLLLLDAAIGGPARAIEYFASVLPLQALSEIHANDQFSLTHALALMGSGDALALRLGSASYALMFGIGIAVTWQLRRAGAGIEYLALAPPAFVLLGGVFLHDLQYMAALPLAVVLFARKRTAPFALATALLCIPWAPGSSRLALTFMFVSLGAVIWIYCRRRSHAPWMSLATLGLLVIVLVALVNAQPGAHGAGARPATNISANESASIVWRTYIESNPALSTPSARDIERKLPTWIAMLVLLGAVWEAGIARKRRTKIPLLFAPES
jgi:hypothetical protein